jgi:CRP-like cAMP-binding protein
MRLKPSFRQAAWIARCLGRGELTPLTSKDVEFLAHSVAARQLQPGERLFGEGDQPNRLWIVQRGELELAVKRAGGRRRVVQVLHGGDVVGDVEMLLRTAHAFGAWAAGDCVVLELRRKDFDTLITRQPRLAQRWLGSLAARLETSQRRIFHLLEGDLRHRVANVLLEEADDDVVRLPQVTLAALIGAQRPSLNKVLKELETAGLIELSYKRVSIRDRDALRQLADAVPRPTEHVVV